MPVPPADSPLGRLMANLPRPGRVEWIGLRLRRDGPMHVVTRAEGIIGKGLVGDRYAGGSGKRGVTLLQAEHLPAIAALSGHAQVPPERLRRNLLVSGIPVVALKGRRFRVGGLLLEGTGDCDPCSRMEDALGPGGFNAMRGHGGLCARILEGGHVGVGDAVVALTDEA